MRKPIAFVAIAVVFAVALFAIESNRPDAAAQGAAQRAVPNQNWQYKTIVIESSHVAGSSENELNKAGNRGWELCESVTHDTKTVLILKRPLQ